MNKKDFYQSQIDYYRANLRCGPSRDWNLIAGLLLKYQNKLRALKHKG
jgi:hypothetical protein